MCLKAEITKKKALIIHGKYVIINKDLPRINRNVKA